MVMCIYVPFPVAARGACMVMKAVVMMFVLISGEVIACQGESIANLTDHGGVRQLMIKYVKGGKHTHLPSEINWQNRIAVLSAINSFEELVTFVNNSPLPCFMDDINDTITQQEIHNLDMVALHHIPDNAPQRIVPLSIKGDGKCLPRTLSYLLCKPQSRYMEMRVCIVY